MLKETMSTWDVVRGGGSRGGGVGKCCDLSFFAKQRSLGAFLLNCKYGGVWASFAVGALAARKPERQRKSRQCKEKPAVRH